MPYVPSKKTPNQMEKYNEDDRAILDPLAEKVAETIAKISKKYNYKGAFAGELNYFETRVLNHLPRKLMETGEMSSELRYWYQAIIFGVQLDVALEYKRRVNSAYEAAQIIKSGDCYDTPYRTQLVSVVNKEGKEIGQIEIMIKREDFDGKDISGKITIEK